MDKKLLSEYMSTLGKRGGKKRGEATKKLGSEYFRKMSLARWRKKSL